MIYLQFKNASNAAMSIVVTKLRRHIKAIKVHISDRQPRASPNGTSTCATPTKPIKKLNINYKSLYT